MDNKEITNMNNSIEAQERWSRQTIKAHKIIKVVLFGTKEQKITQAHLDLVVYFHNRMSKTTTYWNGSRHAVYAARAIDKMTKQLAATNK